MHKINKRVSKFCAVCGDKAMGYNFGAITCEPCKAFFRRNVFRDNLICYFNSRCNVNKITRRFCPKCRLDKCFAIGMRRDWMPCEEVFKKQKDESCVQMVESNSEVSSTNSEINNQIADNNDFITEILDNNTDKQFSAEELEVQIVDLESVVTNGVQDYTSKEIPVHTSMFTPCMCNETVNIKDISTDLNDISNETIAKSIEFEFAVIPIARPIDEYKSDFNDKEMYLLSELCDAVKFLGIQRGHISSELATMTSVQQTIAIKFDNAIKNIGRALRGLTPFRAQCMSDQISLLKYGCLEIIYLRSILSYNCTRNGVTLSVTDNSSTLLKLDILKQHKYNIYQGYIKYMQRILSIWDSDKYIIDLMTSILLFNPDRPNLLHRNTIKLQQHIYMYLLQRYLLLKYPSECEAKSRFLRLMNTTNDLKVLQDIHKSDISDTQSKQNLTFSTPFLEEVLDINPKSINIH